MGAIKSEFEEKEFEAPLYNQLECGTNLVWSPGQVFEQYIGIDRALFLYDPALWSLLGVTRVPGGAVLNHYPWPFWRRRPRRGLPNFRLNLFIQAKRSFYHQRLPRAVRGQLKSHACWRFDIDSSQQEAIGNVAEKLGGRAVVCYAAPVFHEVRLLNAHTSRRTIIQNSTFPLAERLNGHASFYYCQPGGSGVANPDPEGIDGPGLIDLLQGMAGEASVAANETVTTQLALLAADIEAVMSEQVADTNPRRALFEQRRAALLAMVEEYEEVGESARAFVRVASFASAFNLDWYAVVQNQ